MYVHSMSLLIDIHTYCVSHILYVRLNLSVLTDIPYSNSVVVWK